MAARLEHANLSVHDIDGVIRFLRTAVPEFRIRHDVTDEHGRWVHIGTDDVYIALNQAKAVREPRGKPYRGRPGLNHIAFAVDDVDSLRSRLRLAGFQDSTVPNAHPYRKRVYFHDPDGNDWEFVQYFSNDPSERNDYQLPDV